jgi:hypothetical protein
VLNVDEDLLLINNSANIKNELKLFWGKIYLKHPWIKLFFKAVEKQDYLELKKLMRDTVEPV